MLDGEVQQWERPFGPALRAGNRRNIPTTGEKWIAPEATADRKLWRASGKAVNHTEKEKHAESGGGQSAPMQNPKNSVPPFSTNNEGQRENNKQSSDTQMKDQAGNNSKDASTSWKGKEVALPGMDMSKFGPFHLGQMNSSTPVKTKRARVRDETWNGLKELHGVTTPMEKLVIAFEEEKGGRPPSTFFVKRRRQPAGHLHY
nr:uncharacterized protein LOC109189671 [Ipomoea batatas]